MPSDHVVVEDEPAVSPPFAVRHFRHGFTSKMVAAGLESYIHRMEKLGLDDVELWPSLVERAYDWEGKVGFDEGFFLRFTKMAKEHFGVDVVSREVSAPKSSRDQPIVNAISAPAPRALMLEYNVGDVASSALQCLLQCPRFVDAFFENAAGKL